MTEDVFVRLAKGQRRFYGSVCSISDQRPYSVPTRAVLNIVLLAVLAVRSLLPAGFMVQAAHAGDLPFEVVICTSSGMKLVSTDDEGKQAPSKPQHVDNGLCPFAASGAAAVISADDRSLSRTVTYSAVTYTLAAALFAETPKPGATSARGPPASALI